MDIQIKKISFAVALTALAFVQSVSAATLYSQNVAAGTTVNSQGAIGGSDADVFTFASFTATQSGTVDNISWKGTANPLSGYAGYSDGFTIDVLEGAIPLPGSVAYAPVSSTFLASTGLANATLNANGMYDYNTNVKPFYIKAGTTYRVSIRANGIAPWGWATGPGTSVAYVAGVFKFLPSPGIPVYALNNVNNSVVAPPAVNPTTVTIVPVPAPVATTVAGATGDVQGMVTGIGNGFFSTDTVIGGIHGALVTYDGDTVTTYHGGLVTYAVGEIVNYSYTVDVDGIILAKTVDVYPTEAVEGVGRVSGYTTTNGVLNGNGLGLTTGEVLTGSAVPFVNFNYVSSYNLIMSYSGFRNPTTGFVYVTSAKTSALPITVKPVLPAATVGQMFSQNAMDFSLFGQPVNLGSITASGLPAGLTINGGVITGIPTSTGTYTVSVAAYGDTMMLGGMLLGKGTTTIVVNPGVITPPVILDTTAPIITMNGTNVTLTAGTSYVDAGATCTDNVDATCAVTTTSTVDTTTAGIYTVTYSATDVAGNIATPVVRTVTVNPVPVAPVVGTTLANGTVGIAYPATSLASPNVSLFMVSNTPITGIPAGMTVSVAGILSGTPTTAGTYQIGFYAIGSGLKLLGNATSTIVIAPAAVVIPPADTTAPIITMNGTNVTLTAGTSYVDAGATCTDNVDATCAVTTTSTVDTTTAGIYTVTYSATDVAGNIATPVVRTVTVNAVPVIVPPVILDTTAPVITMNGTDVTLIAGNAYVDAGAICMDNVDPTCTVVTTSTVNSAVVGTYTVTYTATDLAGNIATPVVRTVTVNPAIIVTISGAGTVSSIGRNFLVINGGLNASDHVFYTPTAAGTSFLGGVITFATGEYVTFTGTVDGLGATHATSMSVYPAVTFVNVLANAQATIAYAATNLMVSGTAPFTVMATGVPAGMTIDASGVLSGTPTTAGVYSMTLAATDSIGNIGRRVLDITVDAAPVMLPPADTTAPIITMNGTNITLTAGTSYVDAGATCTDNVDTTCTVVTTSTVNSAVVGTYTVTYSATDVAGNIATPVVRTVTVNPVPDTTSPVITMNGSNVTLTAGTSYVDAGATCTDNVDPTCTVVTTSTVNSAVVGTYTVTYSATDVAGNIATPVVRTVTVNPVPVAVTFIAAFTNAQATVAYVAANLLATGVAPFAVTATGVPTGMTVSAAGVLSGTPSTAGIYTVTLSAVDAKGTVGTASRTLTVSAAPVVVTPPTGVVSTGRSVESTNKIITAVTPTTITAGGVLIRIVPTTKVQLNNGKPLVVGNKIEYKGILNTDASVTASSVKIQ